MPKARDKANRASIPRTFGPSAGSSPTAALIAQQQKQNEQVSKLLKTIEQMQIANQEAVQAAGEAGGQAATQVANQVAAGIDRDNQQKERQQERSEDKLFAEDQQRLNAKLQSDAAREAASIGQAVKSQRDAILRFRDSFLAKKASMNEAIAAFSARTDEMLVDGWFSSPKGRVELKQRKHLLDMMQVNSEDHFDDRHLAAVYELHNKNLQGIIGEGEGMDLSSLQVEPLQLPMIDPPHKGGKSIAAPGSITPEKMFELKLHGGYPANGVVFNDEENFSMPPGYEPRLMTGDIMLEVLQRDDYMRYVEDKSLRQELDRKNSDIIIKAMDKLKPLKQQYDNFNKVFNPMAPGAVERSLENFLAEPNPNKFNDMGRTITAGAIMEMFGGGRQGEEMAILAMEIFDGKRELSSDKELAMAMAMESAVFNIKTHMLNEFQASDEKGAGLANQLVQQMIAEIGEEDAARALGVPNNSVGLVGAVEAMNGRLAEAHAFANRMHAGFEKNSLLEQFLSDQGKFVRLADLYSVRILKEGESKGQRVLQLLDQGEAIESAAGRVAGASPQDISGGGTGNEFANLDAGLSMMDAVIILGNEIGPDTIRETAAWVTAEFEPITTPNLQGYLDQTRVEHQRSGYAAAASDHASFNYKRNQRAKAARLKKEQEAGPDVQETFQEKGVLGVVLEQSPALLSLGAGAAANFIGRTAAGTAQVLLGEQAGRRTAQVAKGALGLAASRSIFGDRTGVQTTPLSTQEEFKRIQTLTPAERQQVIKESQ